MSDMEMQPENTYSAEQLQQAVKIARQEGAHSADQAAYQRGYKDGLADGSHLRSRIGQMDRVLLEIDRVAASVSDSVRSFLQEELKATHRERMDLDRVAEGHPRASDLPKRARKEIKRVPAS